MKYTLKWMIENTSFQRLGQMYFLYGEYNELFKTNSINYIGMYDEEKDKFELYKDFTTLDIDIQEFTKNVKALLASKKLAGEIE